MLKNKKKTDRFLSAILAALMFATAVMPAYAAEDMGYAEPAVSGADAEAVFLDGDAFNQTIRALAGSGGGSSPDTAIGAVQWAGSMPEGVSSSLVSVEGSAPISAWYEVPAEEGTAGTVWFYTEGRPALPEDASGMFAEMAALTDISMLKDVDFSNARSLQGMFMGDAFLTDVEPIENVRLDSADTVASMFEDCALLSDVSTLSRHETDSYTAWDVQDGIDMTNAFAGTGVSVFPDWYTVQDVNAEAETAKEAETAPQETITGVSEAAEAPTEEAGIVMDNESGITEEADAKAALSAIMESVRLMSPAPSSATTNVDVSTTGAVANYGNGSTRYYNFNDVANHGVCVLPGHPGVASSETLKQVELTGSSTFYRYLRNLMYIMPGAPGFSASDFLTKVNGNGSLTPTQKSDIANYIAAVNNTNPRMSENDKMAYTHLLMAYGYEEYRKTPTTNGGLGHSLGVNDHWYSVGGGNTLPGTNVFRTNTQRWAPALWAYVKTTAADPANTFSAYLVYGGTAKQDFIYWKEVMPTTGFLQIEKAMYVHYTVGWGDAECTVAGAQYGVYTGLGPAQTAAPANNYYLDSQDKTQQPVMILTIGRDNRSNIAELPTGTYYIREIMTPVSGTWMQNMTPLTVTVTANHTSTAPLKITSPEIERTPSVVLKKVNEAGEPLANVQFKVWKWNGRDIPSNYQIWTTGEDGYTTPHDFTSGLTRGVWAYQEKEAPAGYTLDEKIHSFIIDYSGNVYEGYDLQPVTLEQGKTYASNYGEFLPEGNYLIASGAWEQGFLHGITDSGAANNTVNVRPLYTNTNGAPSDSNLWNISYRDIEKNGVTYRVATIVNRKYNQALTRSGGNIILTDANGSDAQKWIIDYNRYTGRIQLWTWEDVGQTLMGFTAANSQPTARVVQNDGTIPITWTMIPSDTASYTSNVTSGIYTIVPNANFGDILNVNADNATRYVQASPNDGNTGNLMRIEEENGEYLISKTFGGTKYYYRFDATHQHVVFTSNKDHAARWNFELDSSRICYAIYTKAIETVEGTGETRTKLWYLTYNGSNQPISGTQLTGDAQNQHLFRLYSGGRTFISTIANSPNKMRIYKTDNSQTPVPLPGATFRIWNEAGTVNTTLTTGADGYTDYIERLAEGTWHYQETAAPANYIKDNAVYTFYVLSNGKITKTENGTDGVADFEAGPVVNEIRSNKMRIYKTDNSQTPVPLPGATFRIWNEASTVDTTLTTGANGYTDYIEDLAEGTWHYQETAAPANYVKDDTVYTFYVLSNGKITKTENGTDGVTDFTTAAVVNTKYGSAYVLKTTAASSQTLVEGNSLYTLAGAKYVIYSDQARTTAVGEPLITDATGRTQTVQLAPGTYYVKETVAPTGYRLDPKMDGITSEDSVNDNLNPGYWTFTVTSGETTVIHSAEPAKNDPVQLRIKKADAEGGTAFPLSGAQFTLDFYGAWFEDSNYTNKTVPVGITPLKSWVIETKEDPENPGVYISELADGYLVGENPALYKDDHDQTVLPYGTIVIRETKAPANYKLKTGNLEMLKIDSHFEATLVEGELIITVPEQVERYSLTFHKQDSNGTALAGIPFILTNTTTGESHIIVTDAQGNFNSETAMHTNDTNGNDAFVSAGAVTDEGSLDSARGVWFGPAGSVDNEKTALTPGSYTLTELRVRANRHCSLITKTFTLPDNASDGVIDLDTIEDLVVAHSIATRAASVKTGTNVTLAESGASFTDIVTLSGYNNGKPTTITTRAYNVTDGSYIKLNGTEDSIATTVTATDDDEDVTVLFTIDASALAGKKVAIETTAANAEIEMGDVIKHNESHTDENEMLYFPKVATTAMLGNAKTVQAGGTKTVTDRVTVTGLPAGTAITAAAELYELGDAAANDKKVEGAAGESTAAAAADGSVSLMTELSFNTDASAGKSYYVTEKVYITVGAAKHLVASETDRMNADQTVSFIGIGTTLTDSETKTHVAYPGTSVTLNDNVSYSGLTAGKTYPVITVLMDVTGHAYKKDGSVSESLAADLMVCHDQEAATAAAKRAAITAALEDAQVIYAVTDRQATAKNGAFSVSATFDGTAFAGKKTVAAEAVYDEAMDILVTHIVPSDEGQTVRFPSVGTTARSTETNSKMIPLQESVSVTDTVAYSMITPGTEVKTTASVYVKGTAAGSDTLLASKTETRTIGAETGTYDVTVSIDPAGLAGKTLYMTEQVYVSVDSADVLIAEHTDRNDESQTIYAPKLETMAVNTATGDKALNTAGTASITDTLTYTNLVPGILYMIDTEVYAKGAGANGSDALLEATVDKTSFSPETADGTVDVTATFDASAYKGYDIYVNETISGSFAPAGSTGPAIQVKLAEENGKNVPAQTVHAVSLGTTLTETGTEEKSVKPTISVSLTDTVRYDGLTSGITHNAIAIYMGTDGKVWKKDGTASTFTVADLNVCTDAGATTAAAKLAAIKARLTAEGILYAEQSFTADNTGSFTTTLTFNASLFAGQAIVASETVYDANGGILAMHSDASDAGQTITINNSAKAWVHKVSGTTRRGMNGVEFKFWQGDDETHAVTLTTSAENAPSGEYAVVGQDPNGWVYFGELTAGTTYHFKETKTRQGMNLDTSVHTITVLSDGTVQIDGKSTGQTELKLEVANNKAVTLMTGGTGKKMIYIGGTVMLALLIIALVMRKMKKKNG